MLRLPRLSATSVHHELATRVAYGQHPFYPVSADELESPLSMETISEIRFPVHSFRFL